MNPAKQSPRMEQDGTLRWYASDTFSLTFNFTLKDAGGNPISAGPTDTITVTFKNKKLETVHEFTTTGASSITMNFTDAITAKFPEGVYSILVKFNADYVTTLLKNNKVVVE